MPRLPDVNPEHPWDRQQGEGEEAWQAFLTYRDQPTAERSIRRVAQTLGKSDTLITGWSSPGKHRWTERVAAWDQHQQRIQDEAAEQVERRMAASMARRHGQAARALLERALRRLASMTDDDVAKLSADEVARWMKLGLDTERITYGFSTSNVHVIAEAVGTPERIDDKLASLFSERRAKAERGVVVPPEGVDIIDTQAEEA